MIEFFFLQQLHSIVRTDNIVTCLRFLSQGADPNFRNPVRSNAFICIRLNIIFLGNRNIIDSCRGKSWSIQSNRSKHYFSLNILSNISF